MADAHNHHYVPQGYLRRFAQGEGRQAKIFTSDLETGKSFTTLVRNVAALRDFNRIETDGHHPNALEEAYAKFEGPAAEALKRIGETRSIANGDDRLLVINLMALMSTRHPRVRATIDEFMGRVMRGVGEMMTSTKERWESVVRRADAAQPFSPEHKEVTYEQMRDFVRSGEYDIKVHQNMHIGLEIDGMDAVLRTMLARKWVLHVADEHAGDFVTSDNPVCLMTTRPLPAPWMGVGHGMQHTAILFPVTRRMALVGLFEGMEGELSADGGAVARMNSLIITHAERQVYAYDDTFKYAKKGGYFGGRDLVRDPDALRKQD
ncbi:DUF4238 domain-containing protein [Kumtagia ephedrae]|uniref:DUF4238 domain-containing protein n=1 Tax=Kumtagia ephedrae TaxID=2116701 RepID=A0A2P7SDA4_9HYPH|nr:DUF4238 domain-containing protein [Mesorhizobium ephedrae]PSJ60470.1 hypothetical protein C7I84_10805 [Mesorhizobium ephedrae]